jgi:hypothetical protein
LPIGDIVYGGGIVVSGICEYGPVVIEYGAEAVDTAKNLAKFAWNKAKEGFKHLEGKISGNTNDDWERIANKYGRKDYEQMTRVRHYTNRKGLNGIQKDGIIRTRDNNRVYLELANKKPLSQVQAETKYQLKKGRGRDYVEFDVPNSLLEWIPNPRYGTLEMTIKGDVYTTNPEFFKRR